MSKVADDQRNRRRGLEAAFIFAAWTVFGLILANQSYMMVVLRGRPASWLVALRFGLFESYLWALATVAIFWLARRFPLERGRMLRRGLLYVAAGIALALARSAFIFELSRHVEWIAVRSFESFFWGTSFQNFFFYSLLLGIAHAVIYYERFRERERAAERLAAGLTEARLHALKMQLQPHFLFNTLNAISALIPAEARPARRMVARLGDLLRIALEHEATQVVTLREELASLQPYLEIEQARLEERLTVMMEIEPETLDARVPHLMLQPLVENAVRHGIASRIEGGRVEISATRDADDSMLHLVVRDDGPGVDREGQPRTRKGVGLANIQSRLEQLYGGTHSFVLERHPEGGTIVRISLPFTSGDVGGRMPEPLLQ